MKNALWNPFKAMKEWGSRARKEEEHYRSRLTADRAVIGEQMNDFVLEDEQWDDDLDHIDPNCLINPAAVTKTGKKVTEDDFLALADEAEEGYDVELLKERPNKRLNLLRTPIGELVEVENPQKIKVRKYEGEIEIL